MNRTMHGLPAISLKDSLGPAAGLGAGGGARSTMFGLPAIKESVEESSGAELEEIEDATRVSGTILGANFKVQDHGGSNIRSTSLGGLPTIQRAEQSPRVVSPSAPSRPSLNPWGMDDESDGEENATMIAPSSAFAEEDDPRNHSGFSRFGQRVGSPLKLDNTSNYAPEPMNQNATLTGMSIDKLAGVQGIDLRKTSFALPNPLAADSPERMIADEDADDLPTQNITPEDLEQAGHNTSSERNDTRKRLLEKLRTSSQRDAAPPETNMRSTMFGIPGVAGGLDAARAARDAAPAAPVERSEPLRTPPPSGVFKIPKRTLDEDAPGPLDDSGVLGRGAYIVGRGEIKRENTGSLPRHVVDQALGASAPPVEEPRAASRALTATPQQRAPQPDYNAPRTGAQRASTPWVDPDQSQMPGMFGESTAAISPDQLRMINATAAISPDQIGRDLMAMREEPEDPQSDATRVGDVGLADLGAAFGAAPLDAATRVGGADLLAQAQARNPAREIMPTPAHSEPSRPLSTPSPSDLNNLSRPGQRVNPWREAAQEPIVSEPTLNMFDEKHLQQFMAGSKAPAASPPILSEPAPALPSFAESRGPLDDEPTLMHASTLARQSAGHASAPRPTPSADPFSTAFDEDRGAISKPAPGRQDLGADIDMRGNAHANHLPAHELDAAPQQLQQQTQGQLAQQAAPAGLGGTLGKVFGVLAALCLFAGVGLGAAGVSGVVPIFFLAPPVLAALLLLVGALAPVPSAARLGLVIFASILALGVMGLMLSGGALSIPALAIGAGGLFGLIAGALPSLLK
jgi:hypothetical protein